MTDQNDMLELPKDWKWVKLGDALKYVIGGDWGKDKSFEDPNYGLAYCIRGSEIKNWEEEKGRTASLRKVKLSNIVKRKLANGDILVEISGGGPEQPVGRTVLIDSTVLSHKPEIPKICTNFLRLIRPKDYVEGKFLNFYLKLFYYSGEIVKYQGGSNNLRNLKFPDYLKINIPLPPKHIQLAIVSKIEELFSEIENGIESLRTAQQQLKTYRQSVLKWAFEGKLTGEWREKTGVRISAAPHNEKIAAEPETEYIVQRNNYYQKNQSSHKNELPAGWKCVKLGDHIKEILAGKSFKCDERPPRNNEVGIVKVSSVSWGTFDSMESKTCLTDSRINENFLIKQGDFLFSRANTIELVGACVIVDKIDKTLMLSDKILRFTFSKGVSKKFILYYLRSRKGRRQIESLSTGNQDSMRNIGQQKIKQIHFPYCKIEEQNQVVQAIESRFSVADKMEESIIRSLQHAEALKQSILKKAFEGNLF